MKKDNFDVTGMTCAACSAHVNNAVCKVSGVQKVNVNLLQNFMTVEYDETVCNAAMIEDAVFKAGYGATLKSDDSSKKTANSPPKTLKNSSDLPKLVLSFVFLIFLMYFSMGNMMWGWYGFEVFDHKNNPVGFALIQLLLVLPIVALNFHYFSSGFKKLIKGHPNMDTLVAVSVVISIAYGIVVLFMMTYFESLLAMAAQGVSVDVEKYQQLLHTYHDSIYFESAGMILCFVSLGKFFEGISKKKTTKAIEKLIDLSPKKAIILSGEEEREVDISEVKINDTIVVKKGQIIPVDGEIIKGFASINESSITGESIPVAKKEKDMVYCSSILESGYIQIQAKKVGEDTSIAQVVKLVEEASNSKAPISKLADKISGVFVPIIFLIAFLTLIINLIISNSLELSLNFAITVIVIACPCALGLATPVAIMVGTGKGAENGLLIKNAEIMEKVHNIKTVVFDKTGTITEGKPSVTDFVQYNEDENLLSVLYSIEKMSEHPLAKAIVEYAKIKQVQEFEIENFKSVDGLGLQATFKNDTYYIGNFGFAEELKIENQTAKNQVDEFIKNAKIPLIIIKNTEICAIVAIKDKIKTNSVRAISLLKQMGISVVMLTGDNEKTANIVASQVGVDKVYAGVKPDEKLKIIESLKTDDKHLVAMVGDGVNDAPALSIADLGIAIGAGSEIAIETSDIVLQRNDLIDVINTIKLSKRILTTIKIGLFWAFLYNTICVLIATGIFYYGWGFKINPMIGTLAMSFSSVSVVLNALTINFFKPVKSNIESQEIVEENKKACLGVQCVEPNASAPETTCETNLSNEKTNENQNIKNAKSDEIHSNSAQKVEIKTKNDEKLIQKGDNYMEFYVKGMMCQNCQRHVQSALESNGVKVLEVNLDTKKVAVETTKSQAEIFEIVKQAGYDASNE